MTQEQDKTAANPGAILSPQLSPREVVYQDKNRQIYRVAADFGEFTKEYLVADSGRRVGVVVVRDGALLLVRQYRLLLNGLSWEVPGGGVHDGETPEKAAIRECLEEAKVHCRSLKPLLYFQPGLDSYHNPTHLYYTDDYTESEESPLDLQEACEKEWISLSRCIDMIFTGEIVDSLSIIALLSYQASMARGQPR